MTGLIIAMHVIVCVLLIAIILIQRGRGGGLAESFSGAESMFGTKTNAFLTRATTVLSILFFLTCLSLAVLSVKASRSLMKGLKIQEPPIQTSTPIQPAAPQEGIPQESSQQETPKQEEAPKTKTN